MTTHTTASADDQRRGRLAKLAAQDEVQPKQPLLALLGDYRDGVVVLAVAAIVMSFVLFGLGGQGIVTAVTGSVLIVLSAIDVQHRVLPNRIVLPGVAVVLALRIAFFPDQAAEWVLAGLAAGMFLACPLIFRSGGMGGGDIKLAVLLGAALGWDVFGAILVGCLAVVPVALWMLRRGSDRNATLPFGPFLAIGTLVVLFTS